jgi:CBS domain-containing protein
MTAQALHLGWHDLERIRVADAMHRGVVTCARRTSLVTAAHLMASNGIHCIAVVETAPDGTTTLCGVLSDRDVLAAVLAGDPIEDTAQACAATEVVTVTPEDTLFRAAERMHEHGLTHVVVVEPDTTAPVGILSTLDVAAVVGRFWPPPTIAAPA